MRKERKMELEKYVLIMECAIKSAEDSIVEVSLEPSDHHVIRIFFEDGLVLYVTVKTESRPLLETLAIVVSSIFEAWTKERLDLEPQRVERQGVRFNEKWYFSQELAGYIGQEVEVLPVGKFLMVRNQDGEIVDSFKIQH